MPGRVLSDYVSDEQMQGDKLAKLEELMQVLLQGMGDEGSEGPDAKSADYVPEPEPGAEDAESLVMEGQMEAGASPGAEMPAEGEEDMNEEELQALLLALQGG